MSEDFFVCPWCWELSDYPAVHRHPLDACAGYDAETGEPLCEGCVEAAREEEQRP
jgi:hypothetical protein